MDSFAIVSSGTGSAASDRRADVRVTQCLLRTIVLLLLGLLQVGHALADELWRFDPGRSAIDFELAALGVVPVRGRFESFRGEVRRQAGRSELEVDVHIDAGSLAMSPDRYRDWAASSEFFHVRQHPAITFRSDPVPEAALVDGGDITGRLTLRGIERTVSFQVDPADCGEQLAVCRLRVSGAINRTQFGMRSRRLTLSSRVHLDLQLIAVRETIEPAEPAEPVDPAVDPMGPPDPSGQPAKPVAPRSQGAVASGPPVLTRPPASRGYNSRAP